MTIIPPLVPTKGLWLTWDTVLTGCLLSKLGEEHTSKWDNIRGFCRPPWFYLQDGDIILELLTENHYTLKPIQNRMF